MRSDWILDVLADLKTFALSIDLPVLAEQLDDTAIVALAEIASREERMQAQAHGNDRSIGLHSGELGAS
ncbi:hypothetical protein GV827_16340 [Sulfitobacter sp. JBTF-M27]|jgi:hypothetical protein|uniref:Uncharacterized protein n=1 Tax=Sulfitobacter sediminilitoris TaxID=2698830 RepID=A0A6P0CCJ9_9RHOB|nr:hypothetical protein [Sulfitobacter sediminilitoris]NEK23961.1 hypothetical protein [Sulfitobacter sediminilitoris]